MSEYTGSLEINGVPEPWVLKIHDDGAFAGEGEPSTPSSGGVFFVESGKLKYKDSAGTITEIADINPRMLPAEIASSAAAGILTFAGLTVGTPNTTFDVGAVEALVTDYTDPTDVKLIKVSRGASTGETTPYLATNNVTFVGIDKDANLVMKADVPFTNAESRTTVMLGVIVHIGGTIVEFTVNRPAVALSGTMQHQDTMRGLGTHKYGRGMHYAGNAGLTINRSAGALEGIGLGFAGGAFPYTDPNRLAIASEATVGSGPTGTILYVQSDNSAAEAGGSGTLIDPTTFESPLGTLTTVANNKFTIQYIVSFSEGRTNIQYGQTEYSSLDEAKAAIEAEAYTIAPVIEGSALVLAALAIKKECTDMTNPAACFIKNSGRFGLNV